MNNIEEDELLGMNSHWQHVLKYIFSMHYTLEIENFHSRLLIKQIKIDDMIMDKFPPEKRHECNLENMQLLDCYTNESFLNSNALRIYRKFLDISRNNDSKLGEDKE
jgi:hypothetical protein